MAMSGRPANSRLSVDDWVQEGFRVLAEGGAKALALGGLCTRLRVTKGSFYWHFADIRANATFAAGIGFLHLAGSRPSPRAVGRREKFLDVMLRH